MSSQTAVITRLKRIEGQVGGVRKMVETERECLDIITQVNAIRAALDKVALELVHHSIEECLEKGEPMSVQTQAEIAQLLSRLMSK